MTGLMVSQKLPAELQPLRVTEEDGPVTNLKTGPRIWPALIAGSTLMAGVATVLLHLLGVMIHRTYLSEWSISSNQFPKSTDWLLVNGYLGVGNGVAMLFLTMMENLLATAAIVLSVVLYIWLLIIPWNPFSTASKKLSELQRVPKWIQRGVAAAIVAAIAFIALIWFTVVLMLLLGLPAQTGKIIGEDTYKRHLMDFSKGCKESKMPCVQVLQSGEVIGTGYVLDGSPTHLAYFDANLHRSRVIPIDGLEIRALRPPSGYSAPAKEHH